MIEKELSVRAEVVVPEGTAHRSYDDSTPVGEPISLQDERLSALPVVVVYFHSLKGDDWTRLSEYVKKGGFFVGISDDAGELSAVGEGFQPYGGLQEGNDWSVEPLPDSHAIFGTPFNLTEVLPLSGLDASEYRGLAGFVIQGRLSGVALKSRQVVAMFNSVSAWNGGFKASPLTQPRCQLLVNVLIYAMQQRKVTSPQ